MEGERIQKGGSDPLGIRANGVDSKEKGGTSTKEIRRTKSNVATGGSK